MKERLIILGFLLAASCGDNGPDPTGSTGPVNTTEPDLTDCQVCPIGGNECPAGQICVSRVPGSGGICVLACEQDKPEPCTYNGAVVGTCEPFSPNDTPACSDPELGPVCPPKSG